MIIQFKVSNKEVAIGRKKRRQLTTNKDGCNEPFKNKFFCPLLGWFMNKPCAFTCKRECDNYQQMVSPRNNF